MAQIIDFASRKKSLEEKNKVTYQNQKETLCRVTDFSSICERNKKTEEKLRKKREEQNKNVMKTYKIK